jgi:Xaa-Pro aminopeptidase
VLVTGLVKLGILEGPVDAAIKNETYKPYYMHRTSHWLGMDVHDVGDYFVSVPAQPPTIAKASRQPRPLEPGFVLTIEPGLYFAVDAKCDPRWRGIGVRIEDDVLVTETGNRVLTDGIPKSVAELESLLSTRSAA